MSIAPDPEFSAAQRLVDAAKLLATEPMSVPALSADFEHRCDLPCSGGLFLGHTEAAGKARRRSSKRLERLLHIAGTAAPMHDHANALPSPSRLECAKADFNAFVAERCEMISSLVNRLCDGAPRKAGDGPTWSASAN